jgi:hypothetical protein
MFYLRVAHMHQIHYRLFYMVTESPAILCMILKIPILSKTVIKLPKMKFLPFLYTINNKTELCRTIKVCYFFD